jgi:hypothetical protein
VHIASACCSLAAALVIVFGKYDDSLKKAAFTWIGAIVGFWLS